MLVTLQCPLWLIQTLLVEKECNVFFTKSNHKSRAGSTATTIYVSLACVELRSIAYFDSSFASTFSY